jgi:hydrogenase maturation protease
VIGCGNADAGDDAVGLMAVRAVRPTLAALSGVEVAEAVTGLHVLELLDGADSAIVVDAVRGPEGIRPGTPVRLEIGSRGLPSPLSTALSSHGYGLAEAFALAGTLGRLPPTVFLGLHVAGVDAGRPLSPQLARAMPRLVALIQSEIRRLSLSAGVPR